LVHPMDHKEVPPLPGSDLYEPSDVEFYVLGRLESRREYDYRSPVMNDYQRQVNYARCEQIYISGPLGYQPTGLPGNGNGNGNGGLNGGPHGALPPRPDNGLPPTGPAPALTPELGPAPRVAPPPAGAGPALPGDIPLP